MNATVKDYEEIKQVIEIYLKGSNSSGAAAKPAFHSKATINGEPIQTLFDGIDQAGPTSAVGRIDILDVVGDIACARVVMEGWHGMNYVDFHQLMKTPEGWKIVSKVFTQI